MRVICIELMRVICIDATGIDKTCHQLEEGCSYTVYQSELFPHGYRVIGYEKSIDGRIDVHYKKSHFAPCSNIDETEMIRERQTETA